MRRIAFLSTDDLTDFVCDDAVALPALEAAGFEVQTVSWRSPRAWSDFEAVLIRSTWDYQHHLARFVTALERVSAETRLLNPLHIVRWNTHKRYLLELAAQGAPIVPTRLLRGVTRDDLDEARGVFGADELIVKPAVAANADDAYRLPRDVPEAELDAILGRFTDGREALLQPFLPDVLDGEYSLFFFEGALSHAIRKVPCAGDFRVQEEHGGDIQPVEQPDADLVEVGQAALKGLGEQLLYARVDLVRDPDGAPRLMELELVEPALYFRTDPESPARFAAALAARLETPWPD